MKNLRLSKNWVSVNAVSLLGKKIFINLTICSVNQDYAVLSMLLYSNNAASNSTAGCYLFQCSVPGKSHSVCETIPLKGYTLMERMIPDNDDVRQLEQVIHDDSSLVANSDDDSNIQEPDHAEVVQELHDDEPVASNQQPPGHEAGVCTIVTRKYSCKIYVETSRGSG